MIALNALASGEEGLHYLLRRPARLRSVPIVKGPSVALTTCVPAAMERCQLPAVSEAGLRPTTPACSQQQVAAVNQDVNMEEAIALARQHEWPGLQTWRARGIDRRLRWSRPDGGGGAGGSSGSGGEPVLVPAAEAPTLGSVLPPGQPAPASLLQAGLMVLHTACPRGKAALTHAAWSAYLSGELPLRAPGDDGDGSVGGGGGDSADGDGGGGSAEAGGSGMGITACGGRQAVTSVCTGGAAAVPAELVAGAERGAKPAAGAEAQAGARAGRPLAELLPERPARPDRPRLVRPKDIPGHDACSLGLSGYMLHNLAHIELNAIDLAWDTVVRFAPLHLPDQFYEDFARVADDESRHLGWCLQRLGELGAGYGDMDAHDLLWRGCAESALDVAARLAVVPMSQEARGLDAGSRLVARLVGGGDTRSARVVGAIAEEERAHVAVGVTWFARLCAALGTQPGPLFRRWLLALNPDLLKGPFNHSERALVRLPRDWYDPAAWPPEHEQELGQGERTPAPTATATDVGAVARALRESSAGESSGAQQERRRQAPPGRPARGRPHPRLPGPPPLLRREQLAALAGRLALFAEVEAGRSAAEGQG